MTEMISLVCVREKNSYFPLVAFKNIDDAEAHCNAYRSLGLNNQYCVIQIRYVTEMVKCQ